MSVLRICLLLLTLVAAGPARSDTDVQGRVFTSNTSQTPLIELYTSEGCSSCPPADRWLSGLASRDGLWTDFVPVAFHVDYWDYIGWKDRFATPASSARQRELAAEGGSRTVYTPGVFVDGKAWLGWHDGGTAAGNGSKAGRLILRIDGRHVGAQFDPADEDIARPVLHVALLGMGLESEVKAGENRGRKLHHDFVVLGMRTVTLSGGAGGFTGTAMLPRPTEAAARYAVAAWVSVDRRAAPIQAVGGFLPAM
jgi:hypothetical protein